MSSPCSAEDRGLGHKPWTRIALVENWKRIARCSTDGAASWSDDKTASRSQGGDRIHHT